MRVKLIKVNVLSDNDVALGQAELDQACQLGYTIYQIDPIGQTSFVLYTLVQPEWDDDLAIVDANGPVDRDGA